MKFFKRIGMCAGIFYRQFKVVLQVVYGSWRLSKMQKPFVTIFGGARLSQESSYAQKANQLAQKLVDHDISVLTGGGPGVMHAANCGAVKPRNNGKGRSIGIGVKDLGEGQNPCVQEYFELRYFFARKVLLTRFSVAFIIFPGGFGTMDELSEVITLIMTNKSPKVPVVLVGVDYWKHFISWLDNAVEHELIEKKTLELFTVTDDLEKVFSMVRDECDITMEKSD